MISKSVFIITIRGDVFMENRKTIPYTEKIKKIVNDIMNEKNDNPRDSTFRFLQEYHSEAQHISLRFPGIFVKTLPTDVFTINNRSFRMDGAELVLPDDTLPCKSVLNPEQQSKALTPEKVHVLYDYKLQLTFKHKLPSLNVVVTNIGDKDHTVIYESHGDAFKIYIRVFNDKEISQRLSTLTNNIQNKNKLSEIEVLDFAYILLFAQENKANEYTKQIVELFGKVKNLETNLQLEIHYVLKKLIRLHFRDDKEKTKELLTMITKAIHPELLDELPTLKKAIEKEEKRTKQLNNTIDKLNDTRNKLTNTENKLNIAEEEIARLKKILKENNIEVD